MAFDTYMQLGDGSDVVGEATAKGIPNGAFEIFSFSWGARTPRPSARPAGDCRPARSRSPASTS